MKKIIIFHGTGSTSNSYWHPYIKSEMEKKGYVVSVPDLPNADHPTIETSLSYALKNFSYDEETILIGHSSGVSLILSVLENISVKILQSIFVAGFFEPLNPPEPEPMVQSAYDWEKIKMHCHRFTVINSENDPWGCNDIVGRKLADNVGGTFILAKGQGHMGSGTFNQPYKEFPMLLELIV